MRLHPVPCIPGEWYPPHPLPRGSSRWVSLLEHTSQTRAVSSGPLAKAGAALQVRQKPRVPVGVMFAPASGPSSLPAQECGWGRVAGWASGARRLAAVRGRVPQGTPLQGDCCGGVPLCKASGLLRSPPRAFWGQAFPVVTLTTWIRHLPSRTETGYVSAELRAVDLGRTCPQPLHFLPKVILGPRSQMVDSGPGWAVTMQGGAITHVHPVPVPCPTSPRLPMCPHSGPGGSSTAGCSRLILRPQHRVVAGASEQV